MFINEVLFTICEFSQVQDVVSFSETNHENYCLLTSSIFWKFYFQNFYPLETPPEPTENYFLKFKQKFILERKWRTENYRQIALEGHKLGVSSCFIEQDKKSIWTGSYDRNVLHWDMKTGKIMRKLKSGHDNQIIGIQIVDKKYIITCCGSKNYEMKIITSTIVIWEYLSGFELNRIENIGQVMYFYFQKNFIIGLVLFAEKFWIKIFDLDGNLVYVSELDQFLSCSFQDEKLLYLGYTSGEIEIFDLESWEFSKIEYSHDKCVNHIKKNDGLLLTSSLEGCLIISSKKWKSTIELKSKIQCCFNFKNKYIAIGTNRKIIVYENINDIWSLKFNFEQHTAAVSHIWMDSLKLVSASRDCNINIWSMETGDLLYQVSMFMSQISILIVQKDLLVSCSSDATSLICDFSEAIKQEHIKVDYKIQTPIDKLSKCSNHRRNVVLVLTGAFSPIHKMHLKILENSKKFIEEKYNFNVIGGYFSPAHDFYNKFGLLNSYHRVNMCELEVQKSDWIMVDKWECSQPNFVMQDQVLNHIKQELSEKIDNFEVFYCCGSDLLLNQMSLHYLLKYGVICQIRPGYDVTKYGEMENLYFCEEEIHSTSSSLIRSLISKDEKTNEHLSEVVAKYLKEHKLYYK
eukprot:gene7927-12395_t